ncbi:Acetoacetate metabolism regulatory protein AtoC [Candidatus Zixiibacteriota bacterium]|nr:Acetoacetate metabolism regulatory protein AtoC [candidate division Zixibacteria bacterium]
MSIKILVADDDASLRRVIEFKLKQKGYGIVTVADGAAAVMELKQNRYDLLLSDIRMPGLDGFELLDQSKQIQPDLQVILITAHATVAMAVEAVKMGAFDYLTKPFEDESLFGAIDKALKFKKLEDENRLLRKRLDGQESFRAFVGISKPFKDLMAMVEKVAPTDATILLTGESGTGKEVIARIIHGKSHRADQSFVAVNCAAIPKELLESELFGHLKGSFTGAVRDKRGKFELADNGTLLLDEVSELTVELQAKLLRAIQERVIEPVGSEKGREIDIRLIASTNVDLTARVREGRFREDLFYRLNIIPLNVPPLRERIDDLPVLVREFLRRFAPEKNIDLDEKLMDRLENYDWPGNIRELENLMERMIILRKADHLTLGDLPPDFGKSASPVHPVSPDKNEELGFHEAEKRLIVEALDRHGWNRSRAAEHLKIPRHILIYRMKKYGIFYKNDKSSQE